MKFQNCILINFERTHRQAQSNMPLQLCWEHIKGVQSNLLYRVTDNFSTMADRCEK